MFIIKHKKIFVLISTTLVILSILSLSIFGLNIGIDFRGGALIEVVYTVISTPLIASHLLRLVVHEPYTGAKRLV